MTHTCKEALKIFNMTYSLIKLWLSSLDRKIFDPSVSLLISATSWPQSPNCIASTLGKNNNKKQLRTNTSKDVYSHTLPEHQHTFLIGRHCSLYWPLIGSRSQRTCYPQRFGCWPPFPETSCERSCSRCPSLPSRLRSALGTTWWPLWRRHHRSVKSNCCTEQRSPTISQMMMMRTRRLTTHSLV